MTLLKELIDDLGGGRSLSLGAVLVVCCYVAANRYVETVEERLHARDSRVTALEKAEHETTARGQFEGADFSRRIDRLERLEDGRRNAN